MTAFDWIRRGLIVVAWVFALVTVSASVAYVAIVVLRSKFPEGVTWRAVLASVAKLCFKGKQSSESRKTCMDCGLVHYKPPRPRCKGCGSERLS